jgi:hypothetical protein
MPQETPLPSFPSDLTAVRGHGFTGLNTQKSSLRPRYCSRTPEAPRTYEVETSIYIRQTHKSDWMLYRRRRPYCQASCKLRINYKVQDVMTCIVVRDIHKQDKGVYLSELCTTLDLCICRLCRRSLSAASQLAPRPPFRHDPRL